VNMKNILKTVSAIYFFRTLFAASMLITFTIAALQRNSLWKDEVGIWQDAVAKTPTSKRPYFNLGVAYVKDKRPVEAEASLRHYLAVKPGENRAVYYLAEALFYQGKYEEASLLLRELVHSFDRVFAGQGNEQLRREIEMAAEYWVFHYQLGVCYYHLDRFREALAEFETALKLSPKKSEVLNQIGLTYNAMRHYDKAEKAWTDALRIDPSFGLAHESLGLLYLEKLPDRAKARRHLEETIRFFPDHPAREWLEQKISELTK